ncbi:hypothetical protein KIN20_006443 [Parelaphostrongylus tenuis]|uniref:Uncharacterized protein n=1 Tax=Parelaphostrongylus tenuis TaxID=148309 RepID=A0AAD5MN01_PARTN|nr:hypothetical protein KIN20_006443 [Parelaphostrongylus tenuis]
MVMIYFKHGVTSISFRSAVEVHEILKQNLEEKNSQLLSSTYISLHWPEPPSVTEKQLRRMQRRCLYAINSTSNHTENLEKDMNLYHHNNINPRNTRLFVVQRTQRRYSKKTSTYLTPFKPICTSTPINLSCENFGTNNLMELPAFHRTLVRHLRVPKFPPPPIPNEQSEDNTYITLDHNDDLETYLYP